MLHWPVKQVISLATGVTNRQRFQSQSSRRWLQNLGFAIGSGSAASAERPPTSRATASAALAFLPPAAQLVRKAGIVLIGCVKGKRPVAAEAQDLYTSAYFLKMRRYAAASGVPWFILSAVDDVVPDWDELQFPRSWAGPHTQPYRPAKLVGSVATYPLAKRLTPT